MKNITASELVVKLAERWPSNKGTFIVTFSKENGFKHTIETEHIKSILAEMFVNGEDLILHSIEKIDKAEQVLSLAFPNIKKKEKPSDILVFTH